MEVKAIENDFPQPTQTPQSRWKNKSSKIYLPIKEKERESFQPGFVSHLQSLLIKPLCGLIFFD